MSSRLLPLAAAVTAALAFHLSGCATDPLEPTESAGSAEYNGPVGHVGHVTRESPLLPESKLRVIVEGRTFTEGPVWIPAAGALAFSDIPANEILSWHSKDGLAVLHEAPGPNGNALDERGRLLTCLQGGRYVVRWDATEPTELAARSNGQRLNSPNDLAIGSDGTIWFTDPPWGLENETVGREIAGNFVYRLDRDSGEPTAVIRALATPNGIALSPGEDRLYVSDTGGRPSHPDPALTGLPATVSAYPLVNGSLAADVPTWSIETRSDGMCVDARGRLYLTGDKQLTIWSSEGEFIDSYALPATPSNVCFGGARGRTLFITARSTVYALEVDARGLALVGQRSFGDR